MKDSALLFWLLLVMPMIGTGQYYLGIDGMEGFSKNKMFPGAIELSELNYELPKIPAPDILSQSPLKEPVSLMADQCENPIITVVTSKHIDWVTKCSEAISGYVNNPESYNANGPRNAQIGGMMKNGKPWVINLSNIKIIGWQVDESRSCGTLQFTFEALEMAEFTWNKKGRTM